MAHLEHEWTLGSSNSNGWGVVLERYMGLIVVDLECWSKDVLFCGNESCWRFLVRPQHYRGSVKNHPVLPNGKTKIFLLKPRGNSPNIQFALYPQTFVIKPSLGKYWENLQICRSGVWAYYNIESGYKGKGSTLRLPLPPVPGLVTPSSCLATGEWKREGMRPPESPTPYQRTDNTDLMALYATWAAGFPIYSTCSVWSVLSVPFLLGGEERKDGAER